METAITLAKLWGLFLVVIPLSLLLNPKMIKELFSSMEKEITVYVSGIVCLLLGSVTVFFNNTWQKDWKTILTVIGWLFVLRGLASLFVTPMVAKNCSKMKEKEYTSYIVLAILIIGLILAYFGFSAK